MKLELPQHHLKNCCPTRWGSTFDAVDRFLEQETAVRRVLTADYKASHLLLSGESIDTLTAMREALQPVSTFTDLLSGNIFIHGQFAFIACIHNLEA